MDEQYYINKIDQEFEIERNENLDEDIYYTEEDYKELERNLILYKKGNQEAITYIVKRFHPFITKYARFIKFGNMPYTQKVDKRNGKIYNKPSPTITDFVKLFIKKKDNIKKINMAERRKQFSDTCGLIKEEFKDYEYGDIYNELVLALLNMANKYKIRYEGDPLYKENGTFHMYVSKCFHWEAYRFLEKMRTPKDSLTKANTLSLRDQYYEMDKDKKRCNGEIFVQDYDFSKKYEQVNENVSRENDIEKANISLVENKKIDVFEGFDSLNFNWTSGAACGEIFKDLTNYEREIIALSFAQRKTDTEIAEIYGIHRATVNRHKQKAVEKIRNRAEKLNYIKNGD